MSTNAPTAPVLPERVTPPFAGAFTPTSEIGRPRSIVIFARHGHRKTTTAAGIVDVPGINRVLYINIDDGIESFLTEPSVYKAWEDGRIDVVSIDADDPTAAAQVFYYLGGPALDQDGRQVYDTNGVEMTQRGQAFVAEYGYDAIVLDTFDVAQRVALAWFLVNTWSEQGKINTLGGYGRSKEWTLKTARTFQSIRHAIGILLNHEDKQVDKAGKLSIMPELAGGAQALLGGIPSLMLRLEKRKEKDGSIRLYATCDGTDIDAKNRYRLPEEIVDFTLPGLFEHIDGLKAAAIRSAAAGPRPVAQFVTPPAPEAEAAQAAAAIQSAPQTEAPQPAAAA